MNNKYKHGPTLGSPAHQILQRIEQFGPLNKVKFYDIITSGLDNLLERLYNSDYIDMVSDTVSLTDKGVKLAKKRFNASYEMGKLKVYAEKMETYTGYDIINDGNTLVLHLEKDFIIHEPVFTKWSQIQYFRNMIDAANGFRNRTAYIGYSNLNELKLASDQLNDYDNLSRTVDCCFGELKLVGQIKSNWVELKGKRICIVPGLPVSSYDAYLTRLLWMNFELERVELLIARSMISNCPKCGENVSEWFYDYKIKGCKYCLTNLEPYAKQLVDSTKEIKEEVSKYLIP